MKINLLAVFVITFACYSCQQDITRQNRELIIGDWYPYFNGHIPFNMTGYQFSADNQCENKLGFYSYFYPDGVRLDFSTEVYNDSAWFCDYPYPAENSFNILFNVNRAYGNSTIYSLERDTLQIFNPAKQKWMKYNISFQGRDTLQLAYWHEDLKCNVKDRFIRKLYPETDKKPVFEQFIFYTSASCNTGEKFLLIRRDGLLFSYGYHRTENFFIGRILPEAFERIETRFKQANITEIIDNFCVPVVNRELASWYESSVTFVTTGSHKMNSVLQPLGRGLSYEFEWGYLSGVFLPDLLQELKPYFENEYPTLLSQFNNFVRIDIKGFPLYASERFYLGALLCYANEVNEVPFEPKYTVTKFWQEKDIMQTDGRYFSYMYGDQKITLDIGFNFIEVTGLDQANNE